MTKAHCNSKTKLKYPNQHGEERTESTLKDTIQCLPFHLRGFHLYHFRRVVWANSTQQVGNPSSSPECLQKRKRKKQGFNFKLHLNCEVCHLKKSLQKTTKFKRNLSQEGCVNSRVVPVPDKPSSSSLRHSSSSSSSVIFEAWRPLICVKKEESTSKNI